MSDQLLKKKNLRARKGKQKWRKNIDTTFLESTIEERNNKTHIEDEVKAKLIKKPLGFTIDTEPDSKVKKRLDKDRFKKKEVILPPKRGELKLIEKLSKKLKKSAGSEAQGNITMSSNPLVDVWSQPEIPSRKKLPIQELEIASVILPDPGQSYNPSFKEHKKFLRSIIDEEIDRETLKPVKAKKPIITLIPDSKLDSEGSSLKRKRSKNMKVRLQQEEDLARKREKLISHQFNLIKKIKKEQKQDEEELMTRKAELEEKKKLKTEELRKGIVKKGKKFGKFRYRMKTPDFQLVEDMVPNLRKLRPIEGSLSRERFDSIYRRNLIESANPFAPKKKRKVPLYKLHSVNREKKGYDLNEDDELVDKKKIRQIDVYN